MPKQSWALTKYHIWQEDSSCPHFLNTVLSTIPITCRWRFTLEWPVNNPVTSLHCFLSKASRSLRQFLKGPSIDCLIPGVVTQYSERFFTNHSSSWACQHMVRLELLAQDQEVDCLILSYPRRQYPWYPESHCAQGPREALAYSYWTGYRLPVNFPRPALMLSLLPQGLKKLLGCLSKFSFFLYSPLHILKLQRFLLGTLTCKPSGKDSLLLAWSYTTYTSSRLPSHSGPICIPD
jgi:hypothetical protein